MTDAGADLKRHLEQLKSLRGVAALVPPRLVELKDFQSRRLARSYADIAAQPRYRMATAFFLDDLYGPKDFSRRDEAMLRILPIMVRTMPAKGVEAATLAVELEASTPKASSTRTVNAGQVAPATAVAAGGVPKADGYCSLAVLPSWM